MPGKDRNDSFNLKHRLTGAAILIGFAVIVLPILLGGPGEPQGDQGDRGSRAPTDGEQTDTKVFRSNITPIGGATPQRREEGAVEQAKAPEAAAGPEDAPGAAASGGRDAPGPEAGDVAETAESKPADDDGAQQTARREPPEEEGGGDAEAGAADTIERGWIVQVGTFKNPENVDRLVAELKDNGFGTSTTNVETSEGNPATRVWVGPYATRVEAARMKTRVKQRTGSEGLIVAYP